MKTNKIFAFAMMALAVVACNNNNNPENNQNQNQTTDVTLEFASRAYTVAPNATLDLAAELKVTPETAQVTWSTNKEDVATVSDKGVVTGVAIGTAIITAKSGEVSKSVTVNVAEEKQADAIETAVHIWPIILDATTTAKYESKIVDSFGPNDNDRNLWDWNQNTEAITITDKNYYGNNDGYYSARTKDAQWNGLGFAVTDKTPVQNMIDKMNAAPDKFFLHIAIKSTQNYSYWFNLFDTDNFWFTLGRTALSNGDPAHVNPLFGDDFTRDGSWAVYNIPMSKYAAYFVNYGKGDNVLSFGAENVAGNIINLDAIFFYEVQ